MRNFMIILLTWIWASCSLIGSSSSEITLANESKIKIDSVKFRINNYAFTLSDIDPKSSRTHKVDKKLVNFNRHDITIAGKIYSNGSVVKEIFDYTDLSGNLYAEYIFTLKDDFSINRSVEDY